LPIVSYPWHSTPSAIDPTDLFPPLLTLLGLSFFCFSSTALLLHHLMGATRSVTRASETNAEKNTAKCASKQQNNLRATNNTTTNANAIHLQRKDHLRVTILLEIISLKDAMQIRKPISKYRLGTARVQLNGAEFQNSESMKSQTWRYVYARSFATIGRLISRHSDQTLVGWSDRLPT
jgi:hypothetical protein